MTTAPTASTIAPERREAPLAMDAATFRRLAHQLVDHSLMNAPRFATWAI